MTDPTGTEADRALSQQHPLNRLHREEDGLATAEYGIVMLAAVSPRGRTS